MPTYDYSCQACGHEFELFQQMTEPVKRKCPSCGKAKLQRLIGTGAGVIFKGGGFYQTDYRSDSYKKAAEADKKAAEAPAAAATAESKTKADAPTASEPSAKVEPSGAKEGGRESAVARSPKKTAGAKPSTTKKSRRRSA